MNQTTAQKSLFTAKNLALVLVLIGLLISGYLSFTKLTQVPIACTEGETVNCDLVQSSIYAKFMGIPVAYLGFVGYLLIGALLLFEERNEFLEENARLILFVIGLVGWLFSMWLVYVQAVILGSYCLWCLGHELNFTILFVAILYLLWRSWNEVED